jgi:uncharacterized protein YecE (DUF72 family)
MTDTPRSSGIIRVGVGGWTYAPWRDNFYPADLPQHRELEYASRHLDVIEINGTFYRSQSAATFAKWRNETPEDFVFSLKGPRFATNRSVLGEAGESIARFLASGLAELGHKLGPIVWQFAPTKRFDADDFEAFLKLLPPSTGGLALRHALDVRHASFKCAEYLALARRYGMTAVFTDSDDYPSFADITGDFLYVRIMRTASELPHGCTPEALDQLATCARTWREGYEPTGVPKIESAPAPVVPRDVYLFFISAAKEKAPAAAMALLQRLS